MIALWVALAGSAGAVTRFVVDGAVRARISSGFPWATIAINTTGSFLLGILTGLALFHSSPHAVTVIVGTGFCGGYTTFSTASVETVHLLRAQRLRAAAANAFGSAGLAISACTAGVAAVWSVGLLLGQV
jgi:CrcB protein